MNINEIGQKALDIGRELILSYADADLGVEWKADQTPVTIADQGAEEKMRAFLEKEMDCGFVGEEFGSQNLDKDFVWVMDPIDGTKSFIRGVPLYGSLLACLYKGRPIWGAIDISAQGKRVWAEENKGCWLGEKRVQVSALTELKQSCLLSGTVSTFEQFGQDEAFHSLRKSVQLYRGWGDCFGYYMVLCGRAEMMVDPVVSLWDIAPLPVLFQEAGGLFSDLKGRSFMEILPDLSKWEQKADTFNALGTNGLLHEKSLAFF